MDVLEQLLTLVILHEVDLYVIRVQASTHLTDTERLAYLTGTFQYQDLVIIRLQIVFNIRCNLPVQHGNLHFSITFRVQKLHFSIKFSAAKLHFSIDTTKFSSGKMTFRAISSGSLEELLEVFYHLIDILRHLIKVRIKDAFALIP